jgi:hypothetical protein
MTSGVLDSVTDPDPHDFGKPDPDPQRDTAPRRWQWIRKDFSPTGKIGIFFISINVDQNPNYFQVK